MNAATEPFMFVTCKRVGSDLLCTPWSYGEPSASASIRVTGEPITLHDALNVRRDTKGVEWIGVNKDTLARVCALIDCEPSGYSLRWNERATSLDLVVSGFLFRAS